MTRSLADIDVITQDRHSFVANWSKLLDAGVKYKDTCNILDKKQLEKDRGRARIKILFSACQRANARPMCNYYRNVLLPLFSVQYFRVQILLLLFFGLHSQCVAIAPSNSSHA